MTDGIVLNLRIIREDTPPEGELQELERRLENISTTLQLTRELSESLNLEQLELRLASISAALTAIKADDVVRELDQAG